MPICTVTFYGTNEYILLWKIGPISSKTVLITAFYDIIVHDILDTHHLFKRYAKVSSGARYR